MHKDTLAHGAVRGIIRMHTPSRIASLGLWSMTGQSSLVPRPSPSFLSLAVCTARAWDEAKDRACFPSSSIQVNVLVMGTRVDIVNYKSQTTMHSVLYSQPDWSLLLLEKVYSLQGSL